MRFTEKEITVFTRVLKESNSPLKSLKNSTLGWKMKNHSNSIIYKSIDLLPICIAFTTSEKALQQAAKNKFHCTLGFPKVGGSSVYSLHREDAPGDPVILIIYNRGENYKLYQEAALIAHEAVHAWQYIKENINEAGYCPEVEANVIGQITQMVLSWLGYE